MDKPFDQEFLRKLALLKFITKKLLLSGGEGDKLGRKRGGCIEFADYREYTPGDEYRYIDWTVYARTDRLYIKEFSREEQLSVRVLLDRSNSMGFGKSNGTPSKMDYARRLAAALGYVALVSQNRLQISAFAKGVFNSTREVVSEANLTKIFSFLGSLEPQGETDVASALRKSALRARSKKLVVLVSDLMDQTPAQKELCMLRARGFDCCVFHVLAKAEQGAAAEGVFFLKDSETGRSRRMLLRDDEHRRYKGLLTEHCEGWRKFCINHGVKYFLAFTDLPLEKLVFDFLRRGGLLK